MRHAERSRPAFPVNHDPSTPAASMPQESQRWGWASLCLLAFALLSYYLVHFCRILDGRILVEPSYSRACFLSEVAGDISLFLAYISGRLGYRTPMGIIGAGFGLPLLLVDLWAFMRYTVMQLGSASP